MWGPSVSGMCGGSLDRSSASIEFGGNPRPAFFFFYRIIPKPFLISCNVDNKNMNYALDGIQQKIRRRICEITIITILNCEI